MLRKDVIITMIEKKTIGDRFLDIFIVVSLWFLAIIMVYPMLYELFVSFSAPADLYRHRGPLLWFLGFDTSAYQIVLSNPLSSPDTKTPCFCWFRSSDQYILNRLGRLLSLSCKSLLASVDDGRDSHYHVFFRRFDSDLPDGSSVRTG